MMTAMRYGFATKGKTATESLEEEAGREAAQAVLAAAGDYYRCLSAWRMGNLVGGITWESIRLRTRLEKQSIISK